MDGFADVHRVCAHLDGQRDLANHFARMRAYHATAQDLAVAPASMAASLFTIGKIVKQQLGHGIKAAVGNGAARCCQREQAIFHLDALRSCLVLGEDHPGHFGLGETVAYCNVKKVLYKVH